MAGWDCWIKWRGGVALGVILQTLLHYSANGPDEKNDKEK